MYRKILVPLDGSVLAEAALAHARDLARCTGSTLILVRVVVYALHDLITNDPTLSSTLSEDLLAIRRQAETYLERAAADLRGEGFTVSTEVCDDARTADAILECAERERADLIVMSTHGRSGFSRWLLGSVADRVLHGAGTPVLLVRPPSDPGAAPQAG